jgi:hypothetical protein
VYKKKDALRSFLLSCDKILYFSTLRAKGKLVSLLLSVARQTLKTGQLHKVQLLLFEQPGFPAMGFSS